MWYVGLDVSTCMRVAIIETDDEAAMWLAGFSTKNDEERAFIAGHRAGYERAIEKGMKAAAAMLCLTNQEILLVL
jgi:hypothetical protein